MSHKDISEIMHHLYSAVEELEAMFPGRPFTPDGHMVGSIGECLVAAAYELELMPPSNKEIGDSYPINTLCREMR